MNAWIERLKTVLLYLLVLISLILTSLLWNNQPRFELISPPTYVESKVVGYPRQLEELVVPSAIVFHFGNNRHTKADSDDGQYRVLRSEMNKWYFYDFVFQPLPLERWEALTRSLPGLEIQFRSTIPISVVSQLFTFRGETEGLIHGVDCVWLYYAPEENAVYGLFISREERQAIRARTSVSPKDLQNSYLPLGNLLPEQQLRVSAPEPLSPRQVSAFWHWYYVPKQPDRMRYVRMNYIPITDRDLTDAFFLDPTLIRQIVERDGTIIYTDGSRSVQVRPDQQMMTYTDPALKPGREDLTGDEKLRETVLFINQYLGWTDDYRLERMEERAGEGDVLTFRQYLGAYPLVSQDGPPIDELAVTSLAGQVVTLSRSLIDLDTYLDMTEWTVMSGDELFEELRKQDVDLDRVKNAYLAYGIKVHRGFVELIPSWVVESDNGRRLVVNARSPNREGGG